MPERIRQAFDLENQDWVSSYSRTSKYNYIIFMCLFKLPKNMSMNLNKLLMLQMTKRQHLKHNDNCQANNIVKKYSI
jgi:hypothetical protein